MIMNELTFMWYIFLLLLLFFQLDSQAVVNPKQDGCSVIWIWMAILYYQCKNCTTWSMIAANVASDPS